MQILIRMSGLNSQTIPGLMLNAITIIYQMILNYFKTSFRSMLRNKTVTIINITGLCIGLTVCMLILLFTKDELSFDRFHANKDQIYRVTTRMTNEESTRLIGLTNQIVGPSFKEEIPEVEAFIRMQSELFIIRHEGEVTELEATFADDNFFKVFSFPLISGNPEKVLSDFHNMVLSEKTALKYFGTTDVVGKILEIQINKTFEPFVITGVARNPPQNSTIQFNLLLPFKYNLKLYTDNAWVGFYMATFIVLNTNSDFNEVEQKLDKVFLNKAAVELAEMKAKYNFRDKIHFGLEPLLKIHLDSIDAESHNSLAGSSDPIYSYILSAIALFILTIACINFINLMVSHSLKRAKEIGLRKASGGNRSQIMWQFFGESLILCLIAFTIALMIVPSVLPFFNVMANKNLSFSYLFDFKLVAIYILLFLITGFTAGFYPAIILSGFNPIQTLYSRHLKSGKTWLAKSLVIIQFTLATILIISIVGIFAQFRFLTNVDLGYNDNDVIIVHIGRGDHTAVTDLMKQELLKEPSIESTAVKDFGQNSTIVKVNNNEREINIAMNWMDENFLPALRIPIIKGRNFSKDYSGDAAQSVIINETFAREAGWDEASGINPVGQIIDYYDGVKFRVIGMVKDYHFASLKEKISPLLLRMGSGDIWVKTKPGQTAQALNTIRESFLKVMPDRPFEYDLMSSVNMKNYESELKWQKIILVGALLSIIISCLGLFGLAIFTTGSRTKEIGIRKIYGATITEVVLMLNRTFVKWVAIAFLIGAPAGWYILHKWLQNFAYKTELGWWIFVLTGFLTIGIALVTVSWQSLRAATRNPVEALRYE
jgi:putative ABC transport system permease protein